jgi:hypothetical protein
VSIGVGGGLGSKSGGAEAGDFDGEGLIDIPCESEAEFFQSIHFPDDFWAEGGFGASPGGPDQVGYNIFADSNQLPCQVGGLSGFIFFA